MIREKKEEENKNKVMAPLINFNLAYLNFNRKCKLKPWFSYSTQVFVLKFSDPVDLKNSIYFLSDTVFPH